MEVSMSKQLIKALVDVRKAYRLIYLYQKNILSTIDRFAQEFSGSFYWWTPIEYSAPPQRGTDLTKRWAWDFLPLYSTGILYTSGGDNNDHSPGDWLLSFELTTDSSFGAEEGEEPNPMDFEPAEDSETSIIVSLWYCKKAIRNLNWFYGIWNEKDYPEDDFEEFDTPKGLVCIKKEFSLEEMETEELIMDSVNRFKELLSKYLPEESW
jgi:hypothetical protein